MVEIIELAENEPRGVIEKQLNDRSYGNHSDDSGVATSSTETSNSSSDCSAVTSSGYESSNGSNAMQSLVPSLKWENIEGEVVNWDTFSLIMQSSNLIGQSRVCDISSIEHTGHTPILRKGTRDKINTTYIDTISSFRW